MELAVGVILFLVGILATVGFMFFLIWCQSPKKEE
jgi:hypothetical protein